VTGQEEEYTALAWLGLCRRADSDAAAAAAAAYSLLTDAHVPPGRQIAFTELSPTGRYPVTN